MLKERIELIQDIKDYFDTIVFNNKKQNKIIAYCAEQFEFPEDLISDYLRGQKEVSGAETGVLYALSKAIDEQYSKRNLVNEYFTAKEQETFNELKYEQKHVEFPLQFKMIPVAPDSWIGAITAREIIDLYQAQLINYNANTQRALKYIFKRGETNYKIDVNQKAVREIEEAFESGRYISNTLTLNICLDRNEDCSFYYNNQTGELIINKIQMFDILDGYHRLLGIFRAASKIEDFDYPMELRITNYDDNKAKQFIFQEDQKTKMKKVVSEAYNVYSFGNRVVTKLNADPACDIQGMITMSGEYVSQPWLMHLIEYLFFNGINKEEGRQIINPVEKHLVTAFNGLVGFENEYASKRYAYIELMSICYYALRLYKGEEISDIGERIFNLITKLKDVNDVRLQPSIKPTKTLLKSLDKLASEG